MITRAKMNAPVPWLISDSSQGEFHTKCAAQAKNANRRENAQPPAQRPAALGDEVSEAEAHEPGEQHVAVQAGKDHPQEEHADHRSRPARPTRRPRA